jgi:CheY-like chemotaxis protein
MQQIALGPRVARAARASSMVGCRSAVKILIVDEDRLLNRLLSRFLTRNGHEVHLAGDANQALNLLERVGDMGLIVADMQIPDLDGVGFVEALRRDPRRKDLPVVMISASADEQKAERSMRSGAAFFLPKPLDYNRLLSLIRFAE